MPEQEESFDAYCARKEEEREFAKFEDWCERKALERHERYLKEKAERERSESAGASGEAGTKHEHVRPVPPSSPAPVSVTSDERFTEAF